MPVTARPVVQRRYIAAPVVVSKRANLDRGDQVSGGSVERAIGDLGVLPRVRGPVGLPRPQGPEFLRPAAQSQAGITLGVRTSLLLGLVVHISGSATLAVRNRTARVQAYETKRPLLWSFASRQMLLSGLVLLAFVAYHLLHFRGGLQRCEASDPAQGAAGIRDGQVFHAQLRLGAPQCSLP